MYFLSHCFCFHLLLAPGAGVTKRRRYKVSFPVDLSTSHGVRLGDKRASKMDRVCKLQPSWSTWLASSLTVQAN